MRRRHPACGSELAHAPHEAASHHQPDGAIIGVRDQPGWCAGWTEVEADLCVLIRDVHLAMLERCPPGSSRTFRLECGFAVAAGLNALFRHWAGQVHGAQLVLITGWEPGRWQLAETTPALASGTIRA